MDDQKDAKQVVQDVFGRNASKYVTSESHAKGDDLDLVISWLKPEPQWKVLDIATGGGHVAKKLSPYCQQVIATDLTPLMLTAASNHLKQAKCDNVTFVVADAESLPFLDQTFDAVTCRIAAHHFPNPKEFIAEVSRVVRKGGKFLFIDNVAPEDNNLADYMNTVEKKRDESHVRCLSVSKWKEWLREFDFSIEETIVRKKKFHFPTWVARTASSEQQIQNVESFILSAEASTHEYFHLVVENGKVSSFQIDEWRVLCSKILT